MSNITTYSRISFDPLEPDIDKIHLGDIAHALSLTCRANGHVKHFYSVAQHSINCAGEAAARGLSQRIQLACLLHDGSEAYLSDITRPVKKSLTNYHDIEFALQEKIYEAFNLTDLSLEERSIVEEIDDCLLYYEFLELMDCEISESKPDLTSKPNLQLMEFHYVEQEFIRLASPSEEDRYQVPCIGIDGCKGGWICVIIVNGELDIIKISNIDEIKQRFSSQESILIDIPIGLQSTRNHVRPDTYARQIVKERSSTIFPAPCRQAVYADSVSEAYIANEEVLGKKFTPLTVGIIPKIKEVDSFLQTNQEFKNNLLESHPEVCFALLNGKTVLTKKSEIDGVNERISILRKHIPSLNTAELIKLSKNYKCQLDDIIDAICLAVTSMHLISGKARTIPSEPMMDETGLLMQMVIPKL